MAADRAMQVFRQMRIEIKGGDTNPNPSNNSSTSSSSADNSTSTSKSSSSKSVSSPGTSGASLAPDRECYELIIRTFEGCMLSLGSASTRQVSTLETSPIISLNDASSLIAQHTISATTPNHLSYLFPPHPTRS